MKRVIFIFLIIYTILSCNSAEQIEKKILDGDYSGIFQRELIWSDNDTANIIISFKSNTWEGSSDKNRYPALCSGTFLIEGDTITFENDCIWTADFDWSLILSGKYLITKFDNTIEFSKDYRSSTADTYTDKYSLKKN